MWMEKIGRNGQKWKCTTKIVLSNGSPPATGKESRSTIWAGLGTDLSPDSAEENPFENKIESVFENEIESIGELNGESIWESIGE